MIPEEKGTIIIPAYLKNLESVKRLKATLNTIPSFLDSIIVVAQTNTVTEKPFSTLAKNIKFIYMEIKKPAGKWPAFASGLSLLSGKEKWIVVLDADNAYSGEAIPSLISPIIKNNADHVIGNRIQAFLQSDDQLSEQSRLHLEAYFNTLTLLVLDLAKSKKFSNFDIQCGFQAFSFKRCIELEKNNLPFYGGELKLFYESIRLKLKIEGIKVSQISDAPSTYSVSTILDGIFSLDFIKSAPYEYYLEALKIAPRLYNEWILEKKQFYQEIRKLVFARV